VQVTNLMTVNIKCAGHKLDDSEHQVCRSQTWWQWTSSVQVTNVSVHLKFIFTLKMLSVWHPVISLTLHKWTLPRVTVEIHLVSNRKAASSFRFVCWLFHPIFHMLPQQITAFVDILHHCSMKDRRLAIRRAFCLKQNMDFEVCYFVVS